MGAVSNDQNRDDPWREILMSVMMKQKVQFCYIAVLLAAILLFHQSAWAVYPVTRTVGGYSSIATAHKDTNYGTGTAACPGLGSYCSVNFEYTYANLSSGMIYILPGSNSGSPYAAVTVSVSSSNVLSLNAVNRFYISCNGDSWQGVVSE